MELIRGVYNLNPVPRQGVAVTIGNFDGMHLGHQALIRQTLTVAQKEGLAPAAVIFEPHPREYFYPQNVSRRIFTFREKLRALDMAGIQRVLCLHFDRRLAAMRPEEFVNQILVNALNIRAVVVGQDFRFGFRRSGTTQMLKQIGETKGFSVHCVESVMQGSERVSSTRLRAVLEAGDLAASRRLLGRSYSMFGRVQRGLCLGRTLGMPTANIRHKRPTALRHGVYAVHASWGYHQKIAGVASLGERPTLNLGNTCLLETHVFEGQPDLYGQLMEVEFEAFIRPQQRFETLESLSHQMHKDAESARRLLTAMA